MRDNPGANYGAKESAMKVVKAAAVQLSPVFYSREGTIEKIVGKIHDLSQQGVQFVTFPETIVPYYPYFSFIQAAYQILSGREHLKLINQALTVPIGEASSRQELSRRSASMNVTAELYTTPSFSLMPTVPCFSGSARSHPPTTSA